MRVGCGGEVSGVELAERLINLGQAVDLILLEFSDVASEFARTNEYDQQGFDSPISWIKANCHVSGGAAADRVCAGEQLEHLPESSAALAEGRIGFAHFALLARASAAVGGRLDEVKLLKQAAKQSVSQFRNTCTTHGMRPTLMVTSQRRRRASRRGASR